MSIEIGKYSDSLDKILGRKADRESWLEELSFMPFEEGFKTKGKAKRVPFGLTDVQGKLASWAGQAAEKVRGAQRLLRKRAEKDKLKLNFAVRALYHLERFMDHQDVARLSKACRSLWIATASQPDDETNRLVGGLICVLFGHPKRTKADVKATFEWMIETLAKSISRKDETRDLAKEMMLRNLLACCQALPDNLQDKLILAMGMEPRETPMSAAERKKWKARLITNPKMGAATWEVVREASTVLVRLADWRNLLQSRAKSRAREFCRKDGKPLVISLHSHKGGVGKTSVTLGIALRLAEEGGLNVRVVDCDFMASSWALILRYKKRNLKTFVSLEDYISAHLPDEFETAPSPGSLWENMWAEASGIDRRNHGSLQVALTSPFANKRKALIGRLFPPDLLPDIVDVYFDILDRAKKDKVDCLILDNSPGLWGFSFASLRLTIESRGLAIFVSSPDMHDIIGSLLELAAARDLYRIGHNHILWLVNMIPRGCQAYYRPVELAKRITSFPAVDILDNVDLAYRLVESKFMIVDEPVTIEESKAMRTAFLHGSVARLGFLRRFSEGGGLRAICKRCLYLFGRRTD